MFRIPLASDDSFLLLAPNWSGWGEAGQVLVLAGLLLVPLLLVCGLYRYELKLVSRKAALALVMLRGLGLLLLWSLIGLQPTIGRVEQEEAPSRVIVALDLSGSMNLADPQRTDDEKAKLIDALRLPGDAVDQISRKEIARRLLTDDHLNLLGRLKSQHQVDLVGFHETLLESSEQGLKALTSPAEKTTRPTATNVSLALARALQPVGKNTGKRLGVVLLTDGQQNQGPTPLEKTKELAEQQIAVYPIGLGSRQPPIDLALVDLQAPKQVFKDADAVVEAKIRASGLPAQSLIVELTGSGKFAKQQQTIPHDGKNAVYTASFSIKLAEVGSQRLEIHVRPSLPDTRETTADNNRLTTSVRVAPEKSRVLIVDDEPRWEHHYLASALTRDKDLAVDRVLFTQPRMGNTPETDLEKLGYARRKLPVKEGAQEDPLWQYDCIIVGDVSPEQLPTPERARLERYVADRGGTLVIVAGKRSMPMTFFAGPADDPLLKLLPLRQPFVVAPKDGFAFAATEVGERIGFFDLENDVEASKQRWRDMPAHFWAIAGIPKPGAAVLARADTATTAASTQLAADAGIVLQQAYGFGKTLYIGIDSTWRWRYRVGDVHHHRFWGQLVRWAISDPWLPEGNRLVRYGAKAPIYRHDQEVELMARLGEDAPPIAAGTARVKLFRQDGDKEELVAVVPLVQDANRPKQWSSKVKDLPTGPYRIELDLPELKAKLTDPPRVDQSPPGFTILPPESGELIDVATNWDLLQALADQTRGRLYTPADAAQLPDLLHRQIERNELRREERVWQDEPMVWWALGVLLTLLTAEWVVRKFAGLP